MSSLCVKNINVYGSVDYGQPILPNFSDYRTSTSRGLRHLQNPPHEPIRKKDCLVAERALICQTKTRPIPAIDFSKTTTCQNEYTRSGIASVSRQEVGPRASNIHYMRCLQERVFNDPPRPLNRMITEHQSQYKSSGSSKPLPYAAQKDSLTLKTKQADPSFYFRSYQPSYSRYLDPYSTTSELTYIPYTKDAQNGVAKKDIITYYDVLGLPKGPRGFGPRVSTHLLPNTFDPIEDKLIFKNKCRQRTVPFSMIAVPNSGATTEVRTNYSGRPEIPFNLDACDAPPVHQSPWQDVSAPYMYCTEYCHIAHKTPVDNVVNVYRKH